MITSNTFISKCVFFVACSRYFQLCLSESVKTVRKWLLDYYTCSVPLLRYFEFFHIPPSIFTCPIGSNFDHFFCSIYQILIKVAQNMQFYISIVGITVQVKRSIRSEVICCKLILRFSVHLPKFGTEKWNLIFFLIFSKFWLITFYYFYKPTAGCQQLEKVNNWCRTTT